MSNNVFQFTRWQHETVTLPYGGSRTPFNSIRGRTS